MLMTTWKKQMKKQLSFQPAALDELTDGLYNPFRGWYRIFSFRVDRAPDLDGVRYCLSDDESCVLVILDIGAYRSRGLDKAALLRIGNILGFFDENRKDIILRVVYDREGKGTEHEPSLLNRVLEHIRQLEPVIQRFRDRIVIFEGLLVGSWGEMHGSKFMSKDCMIACDRELSVTAKGIFRAVRRPVHWRMLNSSPPKKGVMTALFNDAVFGSETDLGTFASDSDDSREWEKPWARERELDFESQLGEYVPQCGEAVCGENCALTTFSETVSRLRRMRLCCLNSTYDPKILDIWKNMTHGGHGIWQGMNGYDYIGRHLGYRFCLRSANIRGGRKYCKVEVTIENVGFAGFYQEAKVYIAVSHSMGATFEDVTDWDIREIKSGQTKTLTYNIPFSEGKVYLYIKRKWDMSTVWLANPSDKDGRVFIGTLKF